MNTYKSKLIEVALPLTAINAAAGGEGSVGQRPHPKNLHRWWARRPLAAARAVIWASLVDDPSSDPTLSFDEQELERQRLFRILERLVKWEATTDLRLLTEARAEIDRCFPDGVPPLLDPFGGGGAIPLEAQRLGLQALSGDLNPVSVLIQRSMVTLPPLFVDQRPVFPGVATGLSSWQLAQGLAADVEAYGRLLQEQALDRIGQFYPNVLDPSGSPATPIAWIWARTIASPDPSWHGHVPLVSSWKLANKKGKPMVWVEPLIDREAQTISYAVRTGGAPSHERTVDRGVGRCVATGATIPADFVKAESRAGRTGLALMAVVADGSTGRVYCEATAEQEQLALVAQPAWKPEGKNPEKLTGGTVYVYGMDQWAKLYTPRQLLALTTFSDLLPAIHHRVVNDALAVGWSKGEPARDCGSGAIAYADAITTYLAFVVDKLADFSCSLSAWNSTNSQIRNVFARQAIPMSWDFAEVNPFSGRLASWDSQLDNLVGAVRDCLGISVLPTRGEVAQRDARARVRECPGSVISSDPPYYDNISYADLSDFFFTWLRHNLKDVWPDECATLATPKANELIANRFRAGSMRNAEKFFESGMSEFMAEVAKAQSPYAPVTIYYAYKATETRNGDIRSTGWDTFLKAIIDAGLQVTATWPLRTERTGRSTSIGANALASSIVLACRTRSGAAPLATRGEFVAALRGELPAAVRLLQSGNIAPVDMAQSTIGPGIRVFSRYAKVVEADGSTMSVSDALAIINDVLGEVLDGEEAELDAGTRFASTWYAQHGYNRGASGEADGLARAKNTSLAGLEAAGIGEARGGRFRLYERGELNQAWSPLSDDRLTVWEATQHLVATLERSESEAGKLLHQLGGYADRARQLAYVLFQKATDKSWADEAAAYNGLITAWPALQSIGSSDDDQQQLL